MQDEANKSNDKNSPIHNAPNSGPNNARVDNAVAFMNTLNLSDQPEPVQIKENNQIAHRVVERIQLKMSVTFAKKPKTKGKAFVKSVRKMLKKIFKTNWLRILIIRHKN
jgi:hypothetical protein